MGRECESGCSGDHHEHSHDGGHDGFVVEPGAYVGADGVVYVGDIGQDILNALRTVDDVVSTMVVEPVLDALGETDLGQYTNIISDAHDMRRAAQERAAPRTGPGAIPGFAASPTSPVAPTAPTLAAPVPKAPTLAAAPRSAFLRGLDAFGSALASGAIVNTVDGGQLAAAVAKRNATRTVIARIQDTVRAARRGDASAQREMADMKNAALRGEPIARKQWAAAVLVMRDDDAASKRAAVVS